MNDSLPSSRPTACLTRAFARIALVGFAHFASAQTATAPLTVSTFAGQSGAIGSADGTGANATFINPSGLAVDHQGNVFVADTGNDTIRKITPAGVVTTFAGQAIDPVTGLHNTGGRADGAGPAAEFHFGISIIDSIGSNSLAIDANDNLYVADTLSNSIRKITPAGVVTTIALHYPSGVLFTLNSPDGVAIDPGGNLYVTDSGNCVIRKITPDGVVYAFAGMMNFAGSADGTGNAATFNNPRGIACDSSGNVYVADTNNNTIRKITPSGAVTTLAGSAGTPLENSAGSSDGLGRNARFNGPIGLALDAAGNLFIADRGNHSVRRLTPAGVVSTVAGLSGVAGSASGTGNAIRFNQPYSIAITSSGNFFVADTKNHVIRKGVVAATSPTVAIQSQPEIRIVNVGQSATFSVSVSAAPAPSFQWQRNGAAISGATSASYTLGSPQLSDDRTFYSVVVTSGSLSLTSSSAELQVYPLTVIIPPVIILKQPADTATLADASIGAMFAVEATGNGSLTYQWQKDGIDIPGATSASFTIALPQSSDAGAYRVVVSSSAGGHASSNEATLTVNPGVVVPVSISTQPRSQAVSMGASLTLDVAVAGTPPFTYQWKRRTVAISGATSATFTIASVTGLDADTYTVFVTNASGTATSNPAVVTVLSAGYSASHAVVGPGYVAGGTVTITNAIAYTGALTALSWHVLLPSGWSFVSDAGTTATTRPQVGDAQVLEWIWSSIPTGPSTFTYTLAVPAGKAGPQAIAAFMVAQQAGAENQLLARPDPLVIDPVAFHSADSNGDWKISLLELTRVIELYNQRTGTQRNGQYHPQPGTEDGFAPGP